MIAEGVGRILTATIAVKEEIARRPTVRDGHIKGVVAGGLVAIRVIGMTGTYPP